MHLKVLLRLNVGYPAANFHLIEFIIQSSPTEKYIKEKGGTLLPILSMSEIKL